VAKDKINEATTVASSRSRGGNKTSVKSKETDGTAQELLFTKKIKRLFNMLEDTNAITTNARPTKLN
jgi:hypothetical protein